jgi:Amt family ammonium transporter
LRPASSARRHWAAWAACTGAQLIGTLMGVAWAALGGLLVYGLLKTMGLRLSQEQEFDGADLSIHKISATPEREANW